MSRHSGRQFLTVRQFVDFVNQHDNRPKNDAEFEFLTEFSQKFPKL